MHCPVVLHNQREHPPRMLLYFVENLGHMIRPYSGKGSKNGCGNLSLNLFNQKQLENVLEFMTLGLPFTSLEDGWLLQSISHKFVSEYVKETTVY